MGHETLLNTSCIQITSSALAILAEVYIKKLFYDMTVISTANVHVLFVGKLHEV